MIELLGYMGMFFTLIKIAGGVILLLALAFLLRSLKPLLGVIYFLVGYKEGQPLTEVQAGILYGCRILCWMGLVFGVCWYFIK